MRVTVSITLRAFGHEMSFLIALRNIQIPTNNATELRRIPRNSVIKFNTLTSLNPATGKLLATRFSYGSSDKIKLHSK